MILLFSVLIYVFYRYYVQQDKGMYQAEESYLQSQLQHFGYTLILAESALLDEESPGFDGVLYQVTAEKGGEQYQFLARIGYKNNRITRIDWQPKLG